MQRTKTFPREFYSDFSREFILFFPSEIPHLLNLAQGNMRNAFYPFFQVEKILP